MKDCIARRVRRLMGFVTVVGLLWLVGCRTTRNEPTMPVPSGLQWESLPPPVSIRAPAAVAAAAGSNAPAPPPSAQQLSTVKGTGATPPAKPAYVAELLDILKETKSVDTFIVTLRLLTHARPDHRQVVPTVIRNAERLGIYARHTLEAQHGLEAETCAAVSSAIDELVAGKKQRGQQAPDENVKKIYLQQENAMPILPPIPAGQRPRCDDPPDRAAILRSMSQAERGVVGIYEIWREDFEFAVEKLVDKIDSPRFYPLIGPAQLHHCHWKCTVRYNETIEFASPCGFSFTRPQVEVVYIDRDRLYLYVDNNDGFLDAANTAAPPAKPAAPKRPRMSKPAADDEANRRMHEFLQNSDSLRQLQRQWQRFWLWYQSETQKVQE